MGLRTGAKNLAPTGIRSRTVQPVASRYTDYAIPALHTTTLTTTIIIIIIIIISRNIGFGGLEVACWSLVPRFAGSNPAEAVGFLRAKKSSARLRSLELRGRRILGGTFLAHEEFHLPLLEVSRVVGREGT